MGEKKIPQAIKKRQFLQIHGFKKIEKTCLLSLITVVSSANLMMVLDLCLAMQSCVNRE